MPKATPDYQDAELALRVYDLRRESVMRESRHLVNSQFWPKTFDDVKAVYQSGHSLNAAFRQVGTYWEMVYGIVRHGIVSPDYFMESNGEGLFVYARVAPHLQKLRAELSPSAFRNAEWVSQECAEGRRLFELFSTRVRKVLGTK